MSKSEYFEDTEEDFDSENHPSLEPECSASEKDKEESGIECEFENRDGSWWCTTHNCHA